MTPPTAATPAGAPTNGSATSSVEAQPNAGMAPTTHSGSRCNKCRSQHQAPRDALRGNSTQRSTSFGPPAAPTQPTASTPEGHSARVFQFCSGLVDLVVGVRRHGGGGHRLTLAGERFVGLVAEDITEVGDRGADFGVRRRVRGLSANPAMEAAGW